MTAGTGGQGRRDQIPGRTTGERSCNLRGGNGEGSGGAYSVYVDETVAGWSVAVASGRHEDAALAREKDVRRDEPSSLVD